MVARNTVALAMVLGTFAATVQIAGAQQSERRHFTIAATEPKGGVGIDREPFPTETLPEGGGYVLKQPDASGRWEVSAYVWSPSQVVVMEGDRVVLDFVGINGAEHPTRIEGVDQSFTLKRGRVQRIEFTAPGPGSYPIICHTHRPSMRGEILVLPRR